MAKKILIVDDNVTLRENLKELLNKKGADAFLSKSKGPEVLLSTIEKFLAK